MDEESVKLTVFFEGPFWVGVFERVSEGKLTVCKVTFGAEPKDVEVWEFILKNYHRLSFSPAVGAPAKRAAGSPKRRQRSAGKELRALGIGTKSQQALKLQQETAKDQRRELRRERREAGRDRQFELRQEKRREKHRGH